MRLLLQRNKRAQLNEQISITMQKTLEEEKRS